MFLSPPFAAKKAGRNFAQRRKSGELHWRKEVRNVRKLTFLSPPFGVKSPAAISPKDENRVNYYPKKGKAIFLICWKQSTGIEVICCRILRSRPVGFGLFCLEEKPHGANFGFLYKIFRYHLTKEDRISIINSRRKPTRGNSPGEDRTLD